MLTILSLVLSSIFIIQALASGSKCYYRNGVPTTNSFQPCAPNDPQSHCCDFGAGQTCISNGLCLVKWDSSLNTGACTDSNWDTSACFQGCSQFATLYRCNNNNWCCSNGGNITSCCNDRNVGLFTIQDLALVQNGSAFIPNWTIAQYGILATSTANNSVKTLSSSASASSTPPLSSSSSQLSTSSASEPTTSQVPTMLGDTGSQSLTATIGVALGVGLPLLIVIGILSFFLMRDRARVRDIQRRLDAAGISPYSDLKTLLNSGLSEVQGQQSRSELPSRSKWPSELR